MSMIVTVFFFIILTAFELPALIRSKDRKALFFFVPILVITLTLSILQISDVLDISIISMLIKLMTIFKK